MTATRPTTGYDGRRGAGRGVAAGPLGAVLDIGVPLLAAPLLLFPRSVLPLAGLAAIAAWWTVRRVVWRAPLGARSLGLPCLIILLMAAQALYPSVDLSLSMPKLYGIVLGIVLCFGVASGVRSPRWWWAAVVALMVAAVLVAGIGLVGTTWLSKLPGSSGLYARIPRLIGSVPSSFGTIAGIHPNEVGGTLAFLLPIPLGILLWRRGDSDPISASPRHRVAVSGRITATAVVSVLAAGAVLALTFSRSSFVGVAAALAALLAVRWRPVAYLLFALAMAGCIALAAIGPQTVYDHIVQLDGSSRTGGSTLVSRQEVWNRASYMIQDFPFTGIGLNTFPIVLDNLYPSFLAGPDARIPHAHNIYLQTAVDLGLAGLTAFLGMWAIVAREAVQAFRRAGESPMRGAVAGLGAGMVAYLVYGFTDAITLGAKPLVLLWAMIGLVVAANRLLATTSAVEEEDSCGYTPGPGREGPAAPPALPRLLRETWETLSWLYWAVALLFVVMAYAVDAMAITGWMP